MSRNKHIGNHGHGNDQREFSREVTTQLEDRTRMVEVREGRRQRKATRKARKQSGIRRAQAMPELSETRRIRLYECLGLSSNGKH